MCAPQGPDRVTAEERIRNILEAALLAAGGPLSVERMGELFGEERPDRRIIEAALTGLAAEYASRGIELCQVAGGYRIQVRAEVAPWVARLWEERPARYSRALLETLALVAYRQPITRGEIEDIRGVAVSTPIIRTLLEREWVKVVGHRDVPGRPALYATTRQFLDYFGRRSLEDLPALAEIGEFGVLAPELDLPSPDRPRHEAPPNESRYQATDEAATLPSPLRPH